MSAQRLLPVPPELGGSFSVAVFCRTNQGCFSPPPLPPWLGCRTPACCRWCEGKHKREGCGLLLFWIITKLKPQWRQNMLGKHKSVTDWHRYILQTLNNQMGLQVNSQDGKGSSTASSKLINHYSERFSLTGRVSVALVFVVLNSVSSILGFFA